MTDVAEKLYVCPGESHPISRSVHLARLAAFYPSCRNCPLRCDTGQLPQDTVARLHSTERRAELPPLFRREGVRGVYLNQFSRKQAELFAAALASILWSRSPLVGRQAASGEIEEWRGGSLEASESRLPLHPSSPLLCHSARVLPTVVVGYDERPASPDLFLGVTAGLRRMSCQVVDIGLTTKPALWFAVDHLQTFAGVFVTGSGCGPSWSGLDFVGRQGRPLSAALESGRFTSPVASRPRRSSTSPLLHFSLDDVERHVRDPYHRPTRQAGSQRSFQAAVPYEAGLLKHFHALRPLVVCVGCPSPLVIRTLERLFQPLSSRLVPVSIPVRARDTADPTDADVRRLSAAVREQRADLGLLIDDDGQRCAFFTERGELVPAWMVTVLFADVLRMERPGEPIVLEDRPPAALVEALELRGLRWVGGGGTLSSIAETMRRESAAFGGGVSGRYWFSEAFPTSDAILALAKVLATISRGDAPFSTVAVG